MMRDLTRDEQQQILADLRWYGKTIAGGGPMLMDGYTRVAKRAETHWYEVTLPLLTKLNAVYLDDRYDT